MDKIAFCIDCCKENKLDDFLKKEPIDIMYRHCSFCNGRAFILDKSLKQVITMLREKGYSPQYSCSGHLYQKGIPYIVIAENIKSDIGPNLKKTHFRGGTSIHLNLDNPNKINKKIQKSFTKNLLDVIKKLPNLKNKKYKKWDNLNNNLKSNVFILNGKSNSSTFLNKIKEIRKVKNFQELYNKTKVEDRWIKIENLESLILDFNRFYFKNKLYVLIEYNQYIEKKYNFFYPDSYYHYKNKKSYQLKNILKKIIPVEDIVVNKKNRNQYKIY